MPLKKEKSKKVISKNTKTEMKKFKEAGKNGTSKPANKKAAAIAYAKAGKGKKKTAGKKSTLKENFDVYIKGLLKKAFRTV